MKPFRSRVTTWINGSLGARIIAMVLGLLLVLQVVSFGAVRTSLQNHARANLPEQLGRGNLVLQRLLDQQAKQLSEIARTLTLDDAFRVALGTQEEETIASTLENHGSRIGATEALLVDPSFRPVAKTGDGSKEILPLLPTLQAQVNASPEMDGQRDTVHHQLVLVDKQIHQLVVIAIRMPARVLRGWVILGVPVKKQLVSDLHELAALDLTLLVSPNKSTQWSVAFSYLPAAKAAALAQRPWTTASTSDSGMVEAEAAGDNLGIRARLLSNATAQAVAGPALTGPQDAAILAVISTSIDEAVRLPGELQKLLLGITLFGFVAVGFISIVTARRVTTPLNDLAKAAERLGEGDFTTPIPKLRSTNEVRDLATTFERMRINVADKQAEVQKLAYWDSLTGLPNRVQFSNAVHDAILDAQQQGHSVSVVMMDLDRFKHVNDVLGYRLGDLLLTCLADRLKGQIVRGDDMVARLSGDEFAILLRRGDSALAKTVAQRVLRIFDEPLELEEHTVDMGAGIGMACWPEHANDAEQLLSRAEVAMYTAKRRTAGPLLYDQSIDASSAQTLSLLSELRHAVDHGELRLYLQPKLALTTSEVIGAETLVRWQHPLRGLVPPMQFIPFAEQTGFIRNLTMWIFEEAARHWVAMQSEGITLTLSVNLSTRDLLDQDLPQKFGVMLARHCVPAAAFCLEITESAIMDDPQRALATLEKLSAQGFSLSIDDFGTGYSSLAYLKRLPVDELKIDKSFVMGMETDQDDRKIVRSTIDLAHNLGLTVVAEGVENAKIWDLLRELNCDHAQGYHMGRPMPATEFGRWAEQWTERHAPATVAPRTPVVPATLH